MPVIREEVEEHTPAPVDVDFSQLLALPESTSMSASDALIGVAEPTSPPQRAQHNKFIADWDLLEAALEPQAGLAEPDYSKFENWIPRFIRPEKPCDYCRSKRLDCYLQRGETNCTPCSTLFRECSLMNSHTLESINYNDKDNGTFLDTLHSVQEDVAKERGMPTGIKALNSKGRPSGTSTPVRDDEPGSTKRNGIRFPRAAVKTLREWLDVHSDHPYPTDEEKVRLERQTELKPSQIANWLANARRRRKVAEKRPKVPMSPSLGPSSAAIDIPAAKKPWEELNPFERWQHSPPENEPAMIADIAQAVANTDIPDQLESASPGGSSGHNKRSSFGSGFASHRAPSTTSIDTSAQTSSLSTSSAVVSQGSSQSHGSFSSFSSSLAGKKDRRRRRRPVQATFRKQSIEKRTFQCTFCTDTFKSKYDWTRHEKSLHLSLEKWICAPLGAIIVDTASGSKKCAYCETEDPSEDHIETHNHRQCQDKGLEARTFYRKDHLRQHLRLMHGCEMTAGMGDWKAIAVNINSRCGFCARRFSIWQERIDHLTAHFKAGARMSEWKGCRGLDPAVAAQVTNAMPPYLIGFESTSPNPFSATGRGLKRQGPDGCSQMSETCSAATAGLSLGAKTTCWEVLTIRLGKYANEMANSGVVLADDMLQQQARLIIFGSDDTWNQTAADNPEWLDLFKKAYGLDYIPSTIGGEGLQIPEDLETYGDLGLRIPFAAQLQALNHSQAQQQIPDHDPCPPAYAVQLDLRKKALQNACALLSKDDLLRDQDFRCGHAECGNNTVDLSFFDLQPEAGPRYKRWCDHMLTPEITVHASILRGIENPRNDASPTETSPTQRQPRRAEALAALTRLDAPMQDPEDIASKKSYLQRHLYELPKERADQFATTTGPWTDCGLMPPSIDNPRATTTGAMMEFLGGVVGQDLPFSNDALSSALQFGGDVGGLDWQRQFNDERTLRELDEFLTESSGAVGSAAQTTAATSGEALPGVEFDDSWIRDVGMDDLAMDDDAAGGLVEDLDFDGVFDMPMDETFDLAG